MKKKISCLLIAALFAVGATGCSRFLKDNEINKDVETVKGTIEITYKDSITDETRTAVLPFTLDYQKAPNTVANFYSLAQKGFYSETDWETFVESVNANSTNGVKLGSKTYPEEVNDDNKKTGKPDYDQSRIDKKVGYTIKGEFSKNGWEKNDNEVKYGSLYMVLSSSEEKDYDSAAAGFAISLTDDENAGADNKKAMGKTVCVFGAIDESGTDDLHNFVENVAGGYVSLNDGKESAKISKITFDKEYKLKLVK